MAFWRRVIAPAALAVVLSACGGNGGVFSTPASDDGGPDDGGPTAADLAPAFIVIDQDPASPVSLTVGFPENDEGLETLVVLGEKVPSTQPPQAVLIYSEDEAEPFSMAFDRQGRVTQVLAPDGTEVRVLSYEGSRATVVAVAPDGAAEVVQVEVPEADPNIFDAMPARDRVTAVPAAYRAAAPPLASVVATATATYTIELSEGLTRSDVLLQAGECRVPPITNVPASSSGTYVTCYTSVGADEINVRTVVDVAALYGGTAPPVPFETVESCQLQGIAAVVGGVLLLGGALVTLTATALAVVTITSLEGLILVTGIGTAATFTNGVMGGSLAVMGTRPCTGAFTTGEGLRLDVLERLEGVSATANYTPIVLRDADRYTVAVRPPQLRFEPFSPTMALDPVTISVVPFGESADRDGIKDGVYTGSVHLDGVVASPVWEILDSGVELTVTDEGVDVAIDYTLQFAWRWEAGNSTDACLATVHMAYVGQGPVTDPLFLKMTPVAQDLVSISGTLCAAGGQYTTDAEPEVRAWLANEDAFDLMLSGSFDGGLFDGNIDEFWGVTAATEG